MFNTLKRFDMGKYKIDDTAKKYIAFLEDIASVLKKHNVKDLLIIAGINGQIRNTYLPATGVEDPFYCHISDAINAWLIASGRGVAAKKGFLPKSKPDNKGDMAGGTGGSNDT